MTAVRKYWATALLAANGRAGDDPLFLLDYLLRLLRVGVLLGLWQVLLGGRHTGAELTLAQVLTYTLIAEACREQLTCHTELQHALWDGSVGGYFLRPMSVFGQFAARMAGEWLFGLAFFSLPLVVAAPLLGVDPLPAGGRAAALFVPSLTLAIAVGLAVELFFGALVVYLDHNLYNAYRLRQALVVLLSGALIPLELLPWGLGRVCGYLPFAATASAPLRLYIGSGDPWSLLGLQAFWAAACWVLAVWFWRLNRERLVCHGG
ncbi:MAG: ABC-2 family transporter protein [Candidatus Latescibacterota bacterium]